MPGRVGHFDLIVVPLLGRIGTNLNCRNLENREVDPLKFDITGLASLHQFGGSGRDPPIPLRRNHPHPKHPERENVKETLSIEKQRFSVSYSSFDRSK